jgi:uncharacterized membrane protein
MPTPPALPQSMVQRPGLRFRLGRFIRNSFFSGVASVLPLLVTGWLIISVVGLIDGTMLGWLEDDLERQVRQVPGVGVILALVLIFVFGALTANFIGRVIVAETEEFVNKVPLVRTIYGGAKQLLQQVTSRDRTSFKEAVLVEFPSPGLYSIGFVTSDDGAAVVGSQAEVVAVYIPLAPIPTTGYLLYVPRAAVRPYPLGAEDALKRVLSLGAIQADISGAVQVAPNASPRE